MKKFLIIMLILLLAILSALLVAKIYHKDFLVVNKIENENLVNNENIITPVEEKKVQIFNGNSRPIAVMIDNVGSARPQAGLNEAYIVYEIIVEGNQTRLMALFKDKDLSKIGPIRSSRHYFLDYVLENDAIYTHFGYSDPAKNDIAQLGINNVNGLIDSGFWRDTSLNVAYEHTAFTNMDNILKVANSK